MQVMFALWTTIVWTADFTCPWYVSPWSEWPYWHCQRCDSLDHMALQPYWGLICVVSQRKPHFTSPKSPLLPSQNVTSLSSKILTLRWRSTADYRLYSPCSAVTFFGRGCFASLMYCSLHPSRHWLQHTTIRFMIGGPVFWIYKPLSQHVSCTSPDFMTTRAKNKLLQMFNFINPAQWAILHTLYDEWWTMESLHKQMKMDTHWMFFFPFRLKECYSFIDTNTKI